MSRTHVGLKPCRVLENLCLQVPRLRRPRPLVHRVGEPVVRVVAPLLRRRQLRSHSRRTSRNILRFDPTLHKIA